MYLLRAITIIEAAANCPIGYKEAELGRAPSVRERFATSMVRGSISSSLINVTTLEVKMIH